MERSRKATRISHRVIVPTNVRWYSPTHGPSLCKKNTTDAANASAKDTGQSVRQRGSRLKVRESTNILAIEQTKDTSATTMWSVPAVVRDCMSAGASIRSVGKIATRIALAPNNPTNKEPTREPHV